MEKLKKFLKVSFFVLGFYALINVGAVFASSFPEFSTSGDCSVASSCIFDGNGFAGAIYFYNASDIYAARLPTGFTNPTQESLGLSSGTNYKYVFALSDCTAMTYNACVATISATSGYITNSGSDWNNYTPTPPTPTPTRTTAGIFLPIDDETGEQVGANALMASVGTATSDTVGNIAPVAVVVMSLILAFMFIVTLIGLVKKTDGTKDTKKRI